MKVNPHLYPLLYPNYQSIPKKASELKGGWHISHQVSEGDEHEDHLIYGREDFIQSNGFRLTIKHGLAPCQPCTLAHRSSRTQELY